MQRQARSASAAAAKRSVLQRLQLCGDMAHDSGDFSAGAFQLANLFENTPNSVHRLGITLRTQEKAKGATSSARRMQ